MEKVPEGAGIAYFGSFELQIEDAPPVVHNYGIRFVTDEEAEEIISDPENEFDSYIYPEASETVDYLNLMAAATAIYDIPNTEYQFCEPDKAEPEQVNDGYWINVRLFVPNPD